MTADQESMRDLRLAIGALETAEGALRRFMEGQDLAQREQFTFNVGYAAGLLQGIGDRLYRATRPKPMSDWKEAKG